MTKKLKRNMAGDEILYVDGYNLQDDTSKEEKDVLSLKKTARFRKANDCGRMREVLVRHARKSLWLPEPNQIK